MDRITHIFPLKKILTVKEKRFDFKTYNLSNYILIQFSCLQINILQVICYFNCLLLIENPQKIDRTHLPRKPVAKNKVWSQFKWIYLRFEITLFRVPCPFTHCRLEPDWKTSFGHINKFFGTRITKESGQFKIW